MAESAPKRVTFQQIPRTIQLLVNPIRGKDQLQMFECSSKDQLMHMADRLPLTCTPMANKSGNTVVGYFWVGIYIPTMIDEVKNTVVVYLYMNDHDYRQSEKVIRKELAAKEERFKKERPAWRNIKESH